MFNNYYGFPQYVEDMARGALGHLPFGPFIVAYHTGRHAAGFASSLRKATRAAFRLDCSEACTIMSKWKDGICYDAGELEASGRVKERHGGCA